MPIHHMANNGSTISIRRGSTNLVDLVIEEIRQSLPGNQQADNDALAAKLTTTLQSLIDVRQRINQLPRDDPDRDTDPARPDLFWDGQYLVGRGDIVLVEWVAPDFVIHMRNARRT